MGTYSVSDNTNYHAEFINALNSRTHIHSPHSYGTSTIITNCVDPTEMVPNKEKKKEGNLMKLFNVYVVDNKGNIKLQGKTIVARTRDEAIFELQIHSLLKEWGLTLDEATIITQEIGHVHVDISQNDD